jgi:hypothetical protein
MLTYINLHSFRGFVVDYIAAPISGNLSKEHSQTNNYMTVRMSAPHRSLLENYVGALHYGPGSTPRLEYRGSRVHSIFISELFIGHTNWKSHQNCRTGHRDSTDPCW